MYLQLKKPLAFLDLESTGTNIVHDRIVEIAIVKLLPSGEQHRFHKKINPGIPIPLEASKLHGINNQDVEGSPTFKQVAKDILQFLQGCDLAGFNVINFDIPLLVESFLRVNLDLALDKRKVLDAQRIFHLMEKRNLTAAVQFYCDKPLENAHSAMHDTLATVEVLEAQVQRYQGQPMTDAQGKVLGSIDNNIDQLHQLMPTNQFIDFARRMVYNDKGVAIFNFGKHKGKSVLEVLKKDTSYYDWIMKHDFALDTKRKLTQLKLNASTATAATKH